MIALLAQETDFWLELYWHNLFVNDLEWHYHANHISMTEVYSVNFFPSITLEDL